MAKFKASLLQVISWFYTGLHNKSLPKTRTLELSR